MAQNTTPPEVDPKILEDSQKLWENFIQMSKFTVIATVVVLVLMAAFLL